MKKQRSCIRMDGLDKDQRKDLNDRIQKTVDSFNKEIAAATATSTATSTATNSNGDDKE